MTCTNKQTKQPAEADQAEMSSFGAGKHETFAGGSLGVSQR